MPVVAVALGGALGALARYLLGGAVHRLIPGFFPWGTFVVNVVGCLAFGLVAGFAESRLVVGPGTRAFILIGVLGGFTTFSSFIFESFELVRGGQIVAVAANVAGQVIAGFVALWAGYAIGRAI
jgi:CrcB protein